MKLWRWLLGMLVAATLAAFAWHWVAQDPGYVLIRLRGVKVQTTVIAGVLILLLAWGLLVGLWWLARWPFGAMTRRHRRVSRRRLGEGLLALVEGRHGEAERDLQRAARLHDLRGPAQLMAAEAASRRGEHGRALEALDQAGQVVPRAARVLRARVLRRDGRAGEALALLAPDADSGQLSPGGWREYALAALDSDQPARALDALEPLRKSGALGAHGYTALEGRVLRAALLAAADGSSLNDLWSRLPKAQRRVPLAIDTYARRAAGFGLVLPAMDELESALRREWSPELLDTWGQLEGDDPEARLRRAEGWLDAHPNDARLLLAAARICVRLQLWGKARGYLERSLALDATPGAFEALGDACAGQDDLPLARLAYRNALAMMRGEAITPLPRDSRLSHPDTRSLAAEERDEHGLPRLRG